MFVTGNKQFHLFYRTGYGTGVQATNNNKNKKIERLKLVINSYIDFY